mmetsp:Transcript_12183/g.19678  ORF Transcript_12183/g.19678 Transcript_12183/m.19678 type:complete len:255 (-) Transcript_12183:199-963(-)
MSRCRREKPRAALDLLDWSDALSMLMSVVRLSFLFRYLSRSCCNVAMSLAWVSAFVLSKSDLDVYIRLSSVGRPAPAPSSPISLSRRSSPLSSSPSGTGDGGGAGWTYDTRSFDSLMSSLPLAKSSEKSVRPMEGVVCTKNLSLHEATSAGHSRCACMMTCTVCVWPGATSPVFGLTQYFLGAVVFTLKAISCVDALYSLIVVGICFLSSNRNFSSLSGVTWIPGVTMVPSAVAILRAPYSTKPLRPAPRPAPR